MLRGFVSLSADRQVRGKIRNYCGLESLFIIQQPSSAFFDFPGILEFLRDHIQNTVDKLPALRCAILFCQFDVFVDGHLDGNIGEFSHLNNGHTQNHLIGEGQAVYFPEPDQTRKDD